MSLDPAVWGSVFPELVPPVSGPRSVLGFRVNRIHMAGWPTRRVRLLSIGVGHYAWEPGRNTAECIKGRSDTSGPKPHIAPASGCSCGFYACHDLRVLGRLLGGTVPDGSVLVGVAGTGIVRLHQRGWRAQHARIIVFAAELPWYAMGRFSPYGSAKPSQRIDAATGRALEARYQVPVVPLSEIRDVMLESGVFMEDANESWS